MVTLLAHYPDVTQGNGGGVIPTNSSHPRVSSTHRKG